MYVEKIKNEKLRKKAEQILQKQINPTFNPHLNDEYLYNFRLNLIELEIQNNELKDNHILRDIHHEESAQEQAGRNEQRPVEDDGGDA